jgi:hypothetical protein
MGESRSTVDSAAEKRVQEIMAQFKDVDRRFKALREVLTNETKDWQGQQAARFRNDLVPRMMQWWAGFEAKAQEQLAGAAQVQKNIRDISDNG